MTRKQPRVADYLDHIVQAIERATACLDGLPDAAALETKWMEQDAVIRSITVIGEAATKILKVDPAFVAQHAQVPWQQMSAMRNRVVHDYFEVDLDVVWSTVMHDLPVLRQQVQAILDRIRPVVPENAPRQ
ncbi:DUF86 domain-containing protein [Fontimonas sp. SYSU GA230001]|uniref:HepT-like ribonuclease domain-containing protein n=1 Tax=Fontimonas sp. SYSU GA230001 TaxID=3142450 RepID=UPI0032B52B65